MHMAQRMARWTLAELHRLPDDGNKYELVDGELFVTPAPAPEHEEILAVLHGMLQRYVEQEGLGRVYTPRAVIQTRRSEVEPDLMVRPIARANRDSWAKKPIPHLVVEVLSDSTRRRDRMQKRDFYMTLGVPEYWIVDGVERSVTVVRPNEPEVTSSQLLVWMPKPDAAPLQINVIELFREALD